MGRNTAKDVCNECAKCKCYYKDCPEFQKVAEFKKNGLDVYIHNKHFSDDQEPKEEDLGTLPDLFEKLDFWLQTDRNADSPNTRTKKDVFILHNTSNNNIIPADFVSAFDINSIKCVRCQHIARNIQNLLQGVQVVDKKTIRGVCQHCMTMLRSRRPCYECQKIATKFTDSPAIKQRLEKFLDKRHRLDELATSKGIKRDKYASTTSKVGKMASTFGEKRDREKLAGAGKKQDLDELATGAHQRQFDIYVPGTSGRQNLYESTIGTTYKRSLGKVDVGTGTRQELDDLARTNKTYLDKFVPGTGIIKYRDTMGTGVYKTHADRSTPRTGMQQDLDYFVTDTYKRQLDRFSPGTGIRQDLDEFVTGIYRRQIFDNFATGPTGAKQGFGEFVANVGMQTDRDEFSAHTGTKKDIVAGRLRLATSLYDWPTREKQPKAITARIWSEVDLGRELVSLSTAGPERDVEPMFLPRKKRKSLPKDFFDTLSLRDEPVLLVSKKTSPQRPPKIGYPDTESQHVYKSEEFSIHKTKKLKSTVHKPDTVKFKATPDYFQSEILQPVRKPKPKITPFVSKSSSTVTKDGRHLVSKSFVRKHIDLKRKERRLSFIESKATLKKPKVFPAHDAKLSLHDKARPGIIKLSRKSIETLAARKSSIGLRPAVAKSVFKYEFYKKSRKSLVRHISSTELLEGIKAKLPSRMREKAKHRESLGKEKEKKNLSKEEEAKLMFEKALEEGKKRKAKGGGEIVDERKVELQRAQQKELELKRQEQQKRINEMKAEQQEKFKKEKQGEEQLKKGKLLEGETQKEEKMKQDKMRQGKTSDEMKSEEKIKDVKMREAKAREVKARGEKFKEEKAREEKTKGEKTKEGKIKEDKTEEWKTKEGKTKEEQTKADRTQGEKKQGEKTQGEKMQGEKIQGDKTQGQTIHGEKTQGEKTQEEKTREERTQEEKTKEGKIKEERMKSGKLKGDLIEKKDDGTQANRDLEDPEIEEREREEQQRLMKDYLERQQKLKEEEKQKELLQVKKVLEKQEAEKQKALLEAKRQKEKEEMLKKQRDKAAKKEAAAEIESEKEGVQIDQTKDAKTKKVKTGKEKEAYDLKALDAYLAKEAKEADVGVKLRKDEDDYTHKVRQLVHTKFQGIKTETPMKLAYKSITDMVKPGAINIEQIRKASIVSKVDGDYVEIPFKSVRLRATSLDNLIHKLVNIKQGVGTKGGIDIPTAAAILSMIALQHFDHSHQKSTTCLICSHSDLELELQEVAKEMEELIEPEVIIGNEVLPVNRTTIPVIKMEQDEGIAPFLFKSIFKEEASPDKFDFDTQLEEKVLPKSSKKSMKDENLPPKGIIRYALSDRTFIDKGWTMLPTEKVVRKMNVYRMRPARPEFDWFAHNKKKGFMRYDDGHKLAEFDDNGRGRWYYRNGRLALDYYNCEELNAQQRYVVHSSGEPDARGRSQPLTILATFDYLGNGVVFDHSGKIRLKYNQTEGILLDRDIGPVTHWQWHSLNDPPELRQVMIDTKRKYKDPAIMEMENDKECVVSDQEDMLAIEFENYVKERSNTVKNSNNAFKPYQIKMKALKINEYFSLRVADQTNIYLMYKDGSTNLKLNLGMILDHREVIDTNIDEVGNIATSSVVRYPAETDSVAQLHLSVANAQKLDRVRTRRDQWLRPRAAVASADQLVAAASRPLRPPLLTTQSGAPASCVCKRKAVTSNLYYNTRLV